MFNITARGEPRAALVVAAISVALATGLSQAAAQTVCSGAPLVLTEMDLGSTDGLEIQNVSAGTLDTAGWMVAISDTPYSDVNTVNPIVQALPPTMAAGEIIYWTDGATNPWGNNMFWNPGDFPLFSGWAVILDDTGAIVDFAVWNGMPEADIATINLTIDGHVVTIGDEWLFDGIVTNAECGAGFSVQRQGTADHNDATDWLCQATSLGTQNVGLSVPFQDDCIISVDVDIKPGSDSNPVNPNSAGLIPVAILTTDVFDAVTVDEDSVLFGPAGTPKAHKRAHLDDMDGDGDVDLLLHFRTRDTGIAPGDTEACITGQNYDGMPIEGCDFVSTVPPM